MIYFSIFLQYYLHSIKGEQKKPHKVFNERKLVLWLAHVTVTCHPKKLVKLLVITMACEIIRDIKLLNNTTLYYLIFHRKAQYRPVLSNIVQYCPILSSNIQYCPVLVNIVQVAVLALSCLICYIVKHLLTLSDIMRY